MVYPDESVSNNSSGATWNSDDYVVVLNVTEMRVDPIYSSWANWSQVNLGSGLGSYFSNGTIRKGRPH